MRLNFGRVLFIVTLTSWPFKASAGEIETSMERMGSVLVLYMFGCEGVGVSGVLGTRDGEERMEDAFGKTWINRVAGKREAFRRSAYEIN